MFPDYCHDIIMSITQGIWPCAWACVCLIPGPGARNFRPSESNASEATSSNAFVLALRVPVLRTYLYKTALQKAFPEGFHKHIISVNAWGPYPEQLDMGPTRPYSRPFKRPPPLYTSSSSQALRAGQLYARARSVCA